MSLHHRADPQRAFPNHRGLVLSRRNVLAMMAAGTAATVVGRWGWDRKTSDNQVSQGLSPAAGPWKLQRFYPAIASPCTQQTGQIIRTRLGLRRDMTFSDLLHWLRLFGANGSSCPKEVSEVLTEITDYHCLERRFHSPAGLVKTPHGARYLVADDSDRAQRVARAPHSYQTLAVFAEIGLPLTTCLFASDEPASVKDLLQDCLLNMQLREVSNIEPEWGTMAVALYLPPIRSWQNRWGETLDFDQLARFLMQRPMRYYSCRGTHMISTLAAVLQLHNRHDVLTQGTLMRAEDLCRDVTMRMRRTQHRNGSWGSDWDGESPSEPETLWRPVHVTGHLMECQILLPPSLQLPVDSMDRAGQYLHTAIHQARDVDIQQQYCPYSHAGHVLLEWPDQG